MDQRIHTSGAMFCNKMRLHESALRSTETTCAMLAASMQRVVIPGDTYATIRQAVAAGRCNILLTSDALVSSDIDLSDCASLRLALRPDVTLHFQNCAVVDEDARCVLEILCEPGMRKNKTILGRYPATVRVSVDGQLGTSTPASEIFGVGLLRMSDVCLEVDALSDVVLVSGDTRLDMRHCGVKINCRGGGVSVAAVLTVGDGSVLQDIEALDVSRESVWTWSSSGTVLLRNCNFSSLSGLSVIRFGSGSGTEEVCSVECCSFRNVVWGSVAQTTLWKTCTMAAGKMSSTTTTTTTGLAADNNRFEGCHMYLWDSSPVVTGRRNGFVGCQIRLREGKTFTLAGHGNYATDCSFSFLDGGCLALSGNCCRISGCSPYFEITTGGTFAVKISGGACTVIGNCFTHAVEDEGVRSNILANSVI